MKYSAHKREFYIFDQIGADEDGLFGQVAILQGLEKMKGTAPIILRINSPGGSLYECWGMVALLRERRKAGAKIICYNDGLCASAASVLLLLGDTRHSTKEAVCMIHRPHSYCYGGQQQMLETASVLGKAGESLAEFYASRLSVDINQVSAWLDSGDVYFDADEMLKHGFIHTIVGGEHEWEPTADDKLRSARVAKALASIKVSNSIDNIREMVIAQNRTRELVGAYVAGERHSIFPERFAKFFNRDFQDRYETSQAEDRERYRAIVESLGPIHESEYNRYFALAKNSTCGHVRQLALGVLDNLIR